MRIFAISDLHVDFAANLALVRSLSSVDYVADVLLVAGDASHRLDRAAAALTALRQRFARVFFVPGNHDLWVDDGEGPLADAAVETSLQRMASLEGLCRQLGVETEPAAVGEIRVVPLYGWYETTFSDRLHGDAPMDRISRRWADFKRCRWSGDLAEDDVRCHYFARLNEDRLTGAQEHVITFSHFLPRPELLPPVQVLRFKELPHVSGTDHLERQLRAAGARVHVFGHTHIPWDVTMDGVRYVQNPLSYPHERKRRRQEGIRLVQVG
ncbi:MAG: metallophosphoesterase [bacterium]|nr:metallophosphoesterase [bacterium]